MLDLCKLIIGNGDGPAAEAEVLVLRQQINVLRRTRPKDLPSSRLND
jgi:hypothetical protein